MPSVTAKEVRARDFREVPLEPLPSEPGEPRRAMIPLKASGLTTPIFFVHQAFGEVFQYKRVAERIRDDIPLYGIEARGLRDDLEPRGSIPEMATAYIEEIRRVQPRGPYLITGYSFGGRVVWEMARMLDAAGEDVRLLLIDAGPEGEDTVPLSAIRKIGRILVYHWRCWRSLEGASRRTYRVTVFREEVNKLGARFGLDPEGRLNEFMVRLARQRSRGHVPVHRGTLRSMDDWHFEPFPHLFTLFVAGLQPPNLPDRPTLGFTPDLHPGGIDVRPVPGTHSFLFNEPHVNGLTAAMEEWVDRQDLPPLPAIDPSISVEV